MKDIKELWKKYVGKSAIIFGNGPSFLKYIDDSKELKMPKDLWECDKIGINYNFEKFKDGHKNLKYIFLQEFETYEIIKKLVPNNKLIIPMEPGLCIHSTKKRIKVDNKDCYGYVLQDPLKNRRRDLMDKYYGIEINTAFFSYTNTLQTALHILCYMGYKKIYMIGVDYQYYEGKKIHYDSMYDYKYGIQKMDALRRHKEGDRFLIPQLQEKNKVNIINIWRDL